MLISKRMEVDDLKAQMRDGSASPLLFAKDETR